MDHVIQGRRRRLRRKQTNPDQDRPHRGYSRKGRKPAQIARAQYPKASHHQRQQGQPQQRRRNQPRHHRHLRAKDQGMHTQNRIGPDLGHDGKQCRHHTRRLGIGRRQPEMQRHQRRLDREHAQHQHGRHPDQRAALRRHCGHPLGQIRHVEGAGHRIDRAQRKQEQGRSQQVIDHILHPRLQPALATAMDHQPVGRDQQHFEEHKEVKDIPGQKRAKDPQQLKLQQRMKMPPARIPTRSNGIKHDDQRQKRGQRHHQRRQPVQHQHDAKGGRPIAQFIGGNRAPAARPQQAQRKQEQHRNRRHRKDARQIKVVAHGKDHHRAHQRRDHQWGDDPVVKTGTGQKSDHARPPSLSSPVSSPVSSISIRSVLDVRNDPSASITITAVIAKEITIAVRTSACGSGSV